MESKNSLNACKAVLSNEHTRPFGISQLINERSETCFKPLKGAFIIVGI